ncbi:MAG TPA: DUF4446 family protein [Candidatus Baltobacteraceae bacterium]|jgi:hypothetical protein
MEATILAAVAAFIGALIALLVYHLAIVRPALRRVRADLTTHDELLGGSAAPGTARLSSVEQLSQALAAQVEGFERRASELERLSGTDVSRVGFVRYDAFDDTGSELSYALALLNREGDGVVVSSIYSRSDTRTFGKAVEKFKPLVNASGEELSAITKARGVKEER